MTALFVEWLTLFARWFHFIAGVAWIGASFYFIWVENVLEKAEGKGSEKLQGHLTALHGGGFYHVEKFKVAPSKLPANLHWFKWEAYSTWLSGILLMALVYYLNAMTWLISPESGLVAWEGIAISLASLTFALAAYVALCATPLLAHPTIMACIGLVASLAMLAGLREIFTERAAMIHLGAMFGTIMAGNVLFVIIPGQKRLVELVKTGGKADEKMVKRGLLRSTHNNYLTLPVLLTMISSHHPSFYAGDLWWVKVALLMMGSVLIRHFFNLKNRRQWLWQWLVAGIILLVGAATISIYQRHGLATQDDGAVSFSEIRILMDQHCTSCHAQHPSDKVFKFPPLGFVLDSDELIVNNAEAVYQRTVVDRSMPFNNQTGMTDGERQKVAAWYQGIQEGK